ncbi:hypothetical protein KRX19_07165 [Cardiobacteriaceae bacterium TAE3-ERU3]|nr:hypothetical protein [Cardiobacteriaceae bacterium TAE3-ERU3]
MLEMLIMMGIGRYQGELDDAPAFYWALGFAVLAGLLALVMSGTFSVNAALTAFAVKGLFAWGYFVLLRRFGDSLALWYAIFLLLPLGFILFTDF